MTKILDITNHKYGKLTVLEHVGFDKRRSSVWLCRCDCGIFKKVSSGKLRCKTNKGTRSCGCSRKDMRLQFEEASFNLLYNRYANKSKNKNISFELTREQFANLTKQNCKYCGTSPSQQSKTKGIYGIYIYNGIDRLDSSLGYTLENCAPCCGMCNLMKNDYTFSEFLNQIEKISKNLQLKA